MKALKNLSNAVPPRARLIFIAGFFIMALILVVVWRKMTETANVDAPAVQTGVHVETSIGRIEKPRLDETSTLSDSSPMMEEIKKDNEKKIEVAETTDASYIDGLRFRQQERQDARERENATTQRRPETGIDDITRQRDKERARQGQAQGQGNAQVALFDEDQFLKDELTLAKVTKEPMKKSFGDIDKKVGFVAVSNYDDSGASSIGSASDKSGEDPYTSQYMAKYKGGAAKGGISFEDQVLGRGSKNVETKTLNRGTRYYSVLNIGINTDEISPTTATVLEGGDLIGAEFIAETPARAGEKAVVIFNSMSVGGKDYSVRAIALDPETQRSGLADSVDRHIMERYLKLGIAAFVDGYADSLQDSTTTVSSEGSTTTQNSAVPDGATQTKIAIGKVGEAFVPAFEEEFKRPPTVEVNSGREVVVMLLDPIELPKEKVVKDNIK